MIAKILYSKHSGVHPGDQGHCVEVEGGYEVTLQTRVIKQGGGDATQQAIVFFPSDQVMILPEDDPIIGLPEEIIADNFINSIKTKP